MRKKLVCAAVATVAVLAVVNCSIEGLPANNAGGASGAEAGANEGGSPSISGGAESGGEGGARRIPAGGVGGLGEEPSAGAGGVGPTDAPSSCDGLAANCGLAENDDCCASPTVTGGSFQLGDPAASAATIATFALDKYEVTVGRFRTFVEAYKGPPANGAGAHPLIANSGWQSAWNSAIAESSAKLAAAVQSVQCGPVYQTWDASGKNDQLPMNCMNWYEAFAFCAWDGGRLPTDAEQEYAAAGGAQERLYSWGNDPPSDTLAVYDCAGAGTPGTCTFSDLLPVGSKPAGKGRYGQLDLAGSMSEWALDWNASYSATCDNCANLTAASLGRVIRSGSFDGSASLLAAATRELFDPEKRSISIAIRCARTP